MGWPPERCRGKWIPNGFRGYSAWPYSPIQDDENRPLDRCRTRQWFGLAWAMALCTLSLVAAMMLFGRSREGTLPILAAASESEVSPSNIKLRVYNTYTKDHPIQHYPWEYVAEPYRATMLEIQSWPGWEDNVDYRWDVEDETRGYGASLKTLFDMPGVYQCVVTAIPRSSLGTHPKTESASNKVAPEQYDTEVAATYHFSVNVKYVRREIRQLTDRDRETFLNAVSVMQRVPSVVGRVLYGDKYYSKDYFNRLHMYYGCGRECDHWHEGAGFVTSHISLTLMYEQSLQAVNPSIALPYWDFTIEGTLYSGPDFRDSKVFSDDWFGTPRPDNVARTPDRGRFAYVPVMTNASGFSEMANAYGLLRAPWNTDENPFMTRHDHLFGFLNDRAPSGCVEYQETLSKSTWMTLSEMLNTEAHGHIHELIGGSWSEEYGRVTMGVTDAVLPFLHTIQPHTKSLWRSGYFNCPETCGVEVPWHQCLCTCNAEAMHGMTPSEVLQDSGILETVSFYDRHSRIIESFVDEEGKVFYTLPGYSLEETKDIFSQLLTVLCSPARIGTNYEGASTNDVVFWVLHPTIDRAWHFSRLTSRNFKHQWRAGHECYGHNPNDTQPFHNLFPLADAGAANRGDVSATTTSRTPRFPFGREEVSGKIATTLMRISENQRTEETKNEAIQRRLGDITPLKQYYSNAELYEMLRPDRWEMPYVYDNFEWPHCEAIGISMAVVP